MTQETKMLVGVDLGQQRDYTAINVTEKVMVPTGKMIREYYYDSDFGRQSYQMVEETRPEYHVRHLERPPLGTSYTHIVDRIIELVKALGEHRPKSVLAVDATGVGRPVMDMLWREIRSAAADVIPCSVTITGGDSVSRMDDGGWRVPKRDLISATLVLLQNEQLKIADALPLKDALIKELLNFRVKINIATAHDSYEAWREGDHDDLVLSVALSCWAGEVFLEKTRPATVYSF